MEAALDLENCGKDRLVAVLCGDCKDEAREWRDLCSTGRRERKKLSRKKYLPRKLFLCARMAFVLKSVSLCPARQLKECSKGQGGK